MLPIGGYISRGGGFVCVRNGGFVVPTFLPFSKGAVVELGSTLMGG